MGWGVASLPWPRMPSVGVPHPNARICRISSQGGRSVLVSVNLGCRQARMRILRFARARLGAGDAPSRAESDVGFPALARVRTAQAIRAPARLWPPCLATVAFELAGSNVSW